MTCGAGGRCGRAVDGGCQGAHAQPGGGGTCAARRACCVCSVHSASVVRTGRWHEALHEVACGKALHEGACGTALHEGACGTA
eukprot:363761-Chlamydomonas_euryale.AAC.35